MGAIAGYQMLIKISATKMTKSSEGTVLGGISSFDRGSERATIDNNEFGCDWEKSIPGLRKMTMSMSGNYNPTDEGQAILLNADGGVVYIAVYNDKSNLVGKQYAVFCSKFNVKAEVAGKQEFSADLLISEAPGDITTTSAT